MAMDWNNYGSQQQSFSGSQFQDSNAGGFFANDDSAAKFGSQPSFSQSQSPATAKKRDEQSLLPVTIKQLQSIAPTDGNRDSKFKIDGKDVGQITLVGVILTVEPQTTNINYMIDDGSGKINVRLYMDLDDNSQRQAEWREGMYVRVVGNLRNLNGGLSVVGFQLIPITDFNELTFHQLEVIACHLRNTKGAPGAVPAPSPMQMKAAPGAQAAYGVQPTYSQAVANLNNVNVINADGASQGASNDFSKLQDLVLKVFENDNDNEAGTNIETVCSKLSQIPAHDIKKAIEYLSDEGHLYSTIDENHFKITST